MRIRLTTKRTTAVLLAGGVLFLLVFAARLAAVPSEFYEARDDGVITLSHARNLVDYGFVGVNPSGERVEGFSAPLQFVIYALAYRLFGLSYPDFLSLQTWVCTFLLGVIFTAFFLGRSFGTVLGSVLVAAAVLASRSGFLEWHASGLENPITHVTFLATILVLFRALEGRRIRIGWAVVPALAGLSRVDGVFHIGPLLVVFALLWIWRLRESEPSRGVWRGRFAGPLFAVVALALIGVVHGWRWRYFGDLIPNTGQAQGISVRGYLELLVGLDPDYLRVTAGWAHGVLDAHGGYAFLVLVPALLLLANRRPGGDRSIRPGLPVLPLLLTTLVATAALSPFVFGKPSLDPVRTTTQAALAIALGGGLLVSHGWSHFRATPERPGSFRPTALALAAAGLGALLLLVSYETPYPLCCPAARFETVREAVLRTATEERIPRPLVATPDLGALSWHKEVNTVDLGRLGSPILARLRRGPLLRQYLLEEAAPDFIECHGAWLRHHYAHTLSHPRFEQLYERVEDSPLRSLEEARAAAPNPPGAEGVPIAGIWIRRDLRASSPSAERHLIDAMAPAPTLSRLEDELVACAERGADPTYIARTAYRFLPELLAHTDLSAVTGLFASHGASPFDLYLLRGREDGRAFETVLPSLLDEYLSRTLGEDPRPVVEGRFQIFRTAGQLVWVRSGAEDVDVEGSYFVRLDTARGTSRQQFSLPQVGYRIGDRVVLLIPLPSVEIHTIEVGQTVGDDVVWTATVGTSP